MGKKNQGSQQIANSDNYYSQLANESSALFSQFNQLDLPALQKLFPELEQAITGQGPLMTAAQAPVNAATARALNNVQGSLGGVANPAALYSDIALNGQTQAGLAGDQMLQSSLSALQNLIGMGYQGVNTGTNALNNAASGEAQIGETLNNQGNAWWQAILGAAGQYYGLNHGQNTTQQSPPAGNGSYISNGMVYGAPGTYSPVTTNETPFDFGGYNQAASYYTAPSAPISGPQP